MLLLNETSMREKETCPRLCQGFGLSIWKDAEMEWDQLR